MKKICASCGKKFECKSESIIDCDCMKVALTEKARQRIALTYNDCICVDCLRWYNENT